MCKEQEGEGKKTGQEKKGRWHYDRVVQRTRTAQSGQLDSNLERGQYLFQNALCSSMLLYLLELISDPELQQHEVIPS